MPEVIANQDGSTLEGEAGPDTIVTRVIPLRHVAAAELIPILRPLVHRGGLRVDILADGEIRVGDVVRAL